VRCPKCNGTDISFKEYVDPINNDGEILHCNNCGHDDFEDHFMTEKELLEEC
jgi:transcription elongation factor Elf1